MHVRISFLSNHNALLIIPFPSFFLFNSTNMFIITPTLTAKKRRRTI